MTRLAFLDHELAALDDAGRRRVPRVITERRGAQILVDGRWLIDASSNDYLGLAMHPAVIAAGEGAGAAGVGASRLITGNVDVAVELEAALAAFHRVPSARLFASGYAANTGVIPVLVGKDDLVLSDEMNHASIIDGCRLSRARVEIFRHNDVEQVARLLDVTPGRRRLVVTESLFSMDGDFAPLAELRQVTEARDAVLMVDDAHAVGVLGDGRGLGGAAGADVVVGTLGKAFGVSGAYVLGPTALADLLWNRARPLVFSTGTPVPVLRMVLAALQVLGSEEGASRRDRLAAIRGRLGAGSHIVPLIVGEERRAMQAMTRVLEQGVLLQAVRPPTVPPGTSRLRLSLSAAFTDMDVERIVDAVRDLETGGWLVPRGTR